jgi:putative transposase
LDLIGRLLDSITGWLAIVLGGASSVLKSRAALQLENIALRHQLGVLQRAAKNRRLHLNASDRFLWGWLSHVWPDWRSVLVIVQPETVLAWHRKGFRLFWTRKVRRGKPGRPTVSKAIRDVIRTMSRENPYWGAPRIHGELLKLGIDIGETSVSKYLVRRRPPPSQTWRTFLDNHLNSVVSVDFFTVATIRFQVLYVFFVLAHERRALFTSPLPHIRLRSGRHTSSGKRFPGARRRDICCVIGIASSATILLSRSRPWALSRFYLLRARPGSGPTSNA